MPDVNFVHLTQRDVVRARIVADIVAAYENATHVGPWREGQTGGR